MKLNWLALAFGLTLASTSLVGCGSDDDDNNSGKNPPATPGGGDAGGEDHGKHKLASGAYRGIFTGGSEMGVIDVTVPEASSAASVHLLADGNTIPLTGTLTPAGGEAVELTGSFDPESGTVSLEGGGYSLLGSLNDNGFGGGYSGPNGGGSFQAASNADGKTEVFCGSIEGAGNGPLTLLVMSATKAFGYVEPDGKTPANMECTIEGTNIDCELLMHPTVEFTGSSSETGWSGTYENTKNGDEGTWTAGSCEG